MKRWLHIIIGLFCLTIVVACSHVQPYLDIAKEKGLSEGYMQVLKRWTRSRIVYSQFETMAHISATLRCSEFNRAYHQEYERIYQLSAAERNKKKEMQDGFDYIDFIFYAYIPDKMGNDFDRHGSIWSVFLMNGKGEKVMPVEVRRIEPLNAIVTEFYPYINPHYGNAYRLRFLASEKTIQRSEPLKLVFASVIANIELEF